MGRWCPDKGNKEFQPQCPTFPPPPPQGGRGGDSGDKVFQERKVLGLIGPDTGSNSQLNRSCLSAFTFCRHRYLPADFFLQD